MNAIKRRFKNLQPEFAPALALNTSPRFQFRGDRVVPVAPHPQSISP